MEPERRQFPRLMRPFDAKWRAASASGACRIIDISAGGCFVQTFALPQTGEHTSVTVVLGGRTFELPGRVVHVDPGMGFSVEFTGLDDNSRRDLADAVAAQSA